MPGALATFIRRGELKDDPQLADARGSVRAPYQAKIFEFSTPHRVASDEAQAVQPKSGSWDSADRIKSLKCLRISTAPQFTMRVITDSIASACG